VSYRPDTPFDSVESAHEYLRLLEEAIAEAKRDVQDDLRMAEMKPADRRLEAQRLVHYKLEKLEQHLHNSSRLLNDLRSLRILLFEERRQMAGASSPAKRKSEAA
jgi:hypothetical protein